MSTVIDALSDRRTAARPRLGESTLAAVVIVLGGCLILAREARRSTFTGDEWSFILQRRGFSADVLLRPHNEHLSTLPILAYKILLAVFGLGSYTPFIVLLLALHATVCILLYSLARRYVGPWVALAPTAIVAVLGPAWNDLLWAFQIGYLGSVAAGLGMALCLERHDRRGDIAACVLLAASLLCTSVGLAMIVLAAVLIALQRPRELQRLWTVGVPVGLYLLWYAFYGVNTSQSSNIPKLPHYVFDAGASAVAAVTGLGQSQNPFLVPTTYGRFVLVIVVVAFIVYLVRGGRPPGLTWAALSTALALWIAEGLEAGLAREPEQSRYQYTAAVLLLLAAASAANGWRPAMRGRLVLGVAILAVCVANLGILHHRAGSWAESSYFERGAEGALEVARGIVPPDFRPENSITLALAGDFGLTVITAGPYFSAVDAFGSSAYSPRQILAEPEYPREVADLIVAEAERVVPSRSSSASPRGAVCRTSLTGTGNAQIQMGPGTVRVRDDGRDQAQLQVRRFASRYRFLGFSVPAGGAVAIRFPSDRATVPWHVRVVGGEKVTLCAVARPAA